MHQSLVRTLLVGLLCAAPSACGPKAGTTPGPLSLVAAEAARTRWPDASAESLERGRQLFLTHCNRCHAYPDRLAYTPEEWPSVVQRMARKAHLATEDDALILRFVLADRDTSARPSTP